MGFNVTRFIRSRRLVFTFLLTLGGLFAISVNAYRLPLYEFTLGRFNMFSVLSVDVLLGLFDLLISTLLISVLRSVLFMSVQSTLLKLISSVHTYKNTLLFDSFRLKYD